MGVVTPSPGYIAERKASINISLDCDFGTDFLSIQSSILSLDSLKKNNIANVCALKVQLNVSEVTWLEQCFIKFLLFNYLFLLECQI